MASGMLWMLRADSINVRAKAPFVQEHGLHPLAPERGRVISVMSPDVGTGVACVNVADRQFLSDESRRYILKMANENKTEDEVFINE